MDDVVCISSDSESIQSLSEEESSDSILSCTERLDIYSSQPTYNAKQLVADALQKVNPILKGKNSKGADKKYEKDLPIARRGDYVRITLSNDLIDEDIYLKSTLSSTYPAVDIEESNYAPFVLYRYLPCPFNEEDVIASYKAQTSFMMLFREGESSRKASSIAQENERIQSIYPNIRIVRVWEAKKFGQGDLAFGIEKALQRSFSILYREKGMDRSHIITSFTRAVVKHPYLKHMDKKDTILSAKQNRRHKQSNGTSRNTFMNQLILIPGVTLTTANTITSVFPTFVSLYKEYADKTKTEAERMNLLATHPGVKVGSKLSQVIYKIFTAEEPQRYLNDL